MLFNDEKEVRSFYLDYAREVGFGVTTRRSTNEKMESYDILL